MIVCRTGYQWHCECNLISDKVVRSTVLAVVDGGSKLENALLQTLIPVLLCRQEVSRLGAVAVEGASRVGHAVAIAASPRSHVVLGVFTCETILDCLKKEFLSSVAGLEPFGILEYLRYRLRFVIRDPALNRLPYLP